MKNGRTYEQAADANKVPKTVIARYVKNRKTNPNTPPKKIGGQPTLPPAVEQKIVENLLICSEWGYPLDSYDVRLIIKMYLDRIGVRHPKFKANMPGYDFVQSFLKRHKRLLSERFCQNIKRSRAAVSPQIINEYFDNLEESLVDVPPENILNYDETNLSDNPGKKRGIVKRGCKYPERVMNESKSCTSLMFAATGSGVLLRPYVVYKAVGLYDTWVTPGPFKIRYNRSKSGWFDGISFEDWLFKVAVPYFRKLPGKKVLIGDNLSSHLSIEAIKECAKFNIKFVFLPANSTDKTQPLDVAFFAPLKKHWREILLHWKKMEGARESCVPKSEFPKLLTRLMPRLQPNAEANIKAGFKKCGISPLNRQKVLDRIPAEIPEGNEHEVDEAVRTILQEMRYAASNNVQKPRKKKLNVAPGKSVRLDDSVNSSVDDSDSDSSGSSDDNASERSDSASDDDESSASDDDESSTSSDKENEPPGPSTSSANAEQFVKWKGRLLTGVHALSAQVSENDWLLVHLSKSTRSKSGKESLFLGMVTDTIGGFTLTFAKYVPSKIDAGQIFTWPDQDDISEVSPDEVIGWDAPPLLMRRNKMKFKIDVNQW